jgi:hypothetical protein
MAYIVLILMLFGGLILLFGLGYLIGHLLKLDKYLKGNQNYNNLGYRL